MFIEKFSKFYNTIKQYSFQNCQNQANIFIIQNASIIESILYFSNFIKLDLPSMAQMMFCSMITQKEEIKRFLSKSMREMKHTFYILINPHFLSKKCKASLIKNFFRILHSSLVVRHFKLLIIESYVNESIINEICINSLSIKMNPKAEELSSCLNSEIQKFLEPF